MSDTRSGWHWLPSRNAKAQADIWQARQEAEQKQKWQDDKAAKSYDNLYTDEAFEERGNMSDDDFM